MYETSFTGGRHHRTVCSALMRDASAAAATEIAADDSAGIKAAPKYYVDAVNVIMKLYS